jgi:oxalate decarboxylase
MSTLQRRDFLTGAAAFAAGVTAALTGTRPAEAGDVSFMNNVPDPLVAGKELPTFKFALEKSEGKVIGKSVGKEATVEQLPISKGIAGVSMTLEPGAMRELHWHATAAEWAFVDRGRVRTTVLGPKGYAETNDFEPGDVWYFPRGHGHMLECLGDEPCHFILIFDNGYFSEFGTFSITDWIGHTPKPLLAKNFGLPESSFDGFPRRRSTSPKGSSRPKRRRTRSGGGGSRRTRTSIGSSPTSPRSTTRAANCGWSIPPRSRSPRPSRARSWTWSRGRCGSCTGTRRPTSGSTSSRGRSA